MLDIATLMTKKAININNIVKLERIKNVWMVKAGFFKLISHINKANIQKSKHSD